MGNVRVGWGWVMHEWGGVGHAGVGWVMQGWFGWGVVCNVAVGWGQLCKGGVGYTVVEWAVKSFTE